MLRSHLQVNLEYNNAGEGVHSIAEALQNHRSLKSLNLTSNQVRNDRQPSRARRAFASAVVDTLPLAPFDGACRHIFELPSDDVYAFRQKKLSHVNTQSRQ